MTPGLASKWLLVLPFIALAATGAGSPQPSPVLFGQLLEESGLQFAPPPGFTDIEPEANPVLHYERALRHSSGALELRFVIRPLGRIAIDYNDPHNAAPEPNHLFPLLFESLTTALSRGGNTPSSEYPQSEARDLFNAGWAAASVFDVNPDFSDRYSQGLLLGIHRNRLADAYTVFLYNDYGRAKGLIKGALSALSFVPETEESIPSAPPVDQPD